MTSIHVLQHWDQVEACFLEPQSLPQPSGKRNDCWLFDPIANGYKYANVCYCYWRVDDPDVVLKLWLDKFVNENPSCGNGGRSAIIQLGTLFDQDDPRAVPAYLKRVPFTDPRMFQRFAALWDKISALLVTYNHSSVNAVDPPEWIISIGNEVDEWLDHPKAIGNPDQGYVAPDGTTAQEAWDGYAAFYHKASQVRARSTVPDLLPQQIAFVGTAFDAWDSVFQSGIGGGIRKEPRRRRTARGACRASLE